VTPETISASAPPLPARAAPAIPPGIGRVLIVIPAFNEAGRVGTVVRDVRRALPGADVLVVDDGSSDTTGREARDAGAALLPLPMNLGYGAALQTGYKYAVRRGYQVIGQIDGDGQHKAEYFPQMLAELTSTW
jgi:glycosyltransferase involved in cell wall biosynthesis